MVHSNCHIVLTALFKHLSGSSEVTGVTLNREVEPGQRSLNASTGRLSYKINKYLKVATRSICFIVNVSFIQNREHKKKPE